MTELVWLLVLAACGVMLLGGLYMICGAFHWMTEQRPLSPAWLRRVRELDVRESGHGHQ